MKSPPQRLLQGRRSAEASDPPTWQTETAPARSPTPPHATSDRVSGSPLSPSSSGARGSRASLGLWVATTRSRPLSSVAPNSPHPRAPNHTPPGAMAPPKVPLDVVLLPAVRPCHCEYQHHGRPIHSMKLGESHTEDLGKVMAGQVLAALSGRTNEPEQGCCLSGYRTNTGGADEKHRLPPKTWRASPLRAIADAVGARRAVGHAVTPPITRSTGVPVTGP
jgi:hypothetical protein